MAYQIFRKISKNSKEIFLKYDSGYSLFDVQIKSFQRPWYEILLVRIEILRFRLQYEDCDKLPF
ncbi:hypothetical protein OOZ35_14205 [Mesoflavibacter profundi]|uniref:Uncharacterized protein n=1 Tax=Mesoflavibacter profundi TaxID=2708110 RepID=A0ABT4S3J5_9FLAO|nr:hypothetical protein [Mesoflavibacter profundi]MDA0175901.1 hypothetical protein [Mesoflavibacter profundi]MDA0178652.1 hypothetical protein [Mesoflavibacter profundi]